MTRKVRGTFDVSLKAKNYKCFQEETTLFNEVYPINLIVGKNNSGKSTLLQTIRDLCAKERDLSADPRVKLIITERMTSEKIRGISEFVNINLGVSSNNSHFTNQVFNLLSKHTIEAHLDKHLFVRKIHYELTTEGSQIPYSERNRKGFNDAVNRAFPEGQRYPSLFFSSKKTFFIAAERDIVAETEEQKFSIGKNGDGATNIFQKILNESRHHKADIEVHLKNALNKIYKGDCEFERLLVQRDGNSWQIEYIDQKSLERIGLGESGSGLKTVILVLLHLLVIPHIEELSDGTNISNIIYCFEELENNLHPKLQRRLMEFIADFTINHGCHVFLTTHSSAIIEYFANDENAQILHVTHDGKTASVTQVESFGKHCAVLDDIGAKASDLLQANGIVWLEGPSDRIYFNKWIEIYSGGELQEHRDYECAFYGGSVLSHYRAVDPSVETMDYINLFKVNRNAILIGDSDRRNEDDALKERLQRLTDQLNSALEDGANVLPWPMESAEVENYLPLAALKEAFPDITASESIGSFEHFYHKDKDCYWKENGFPSTFNKYAFAQKVVPYLTEENLSFRPELVTIMSKVVSMIQRWNSDNNAVSKQGD